MKTLREVTLIEWIVLLTMVAIGIASRFYFAEFWNIKPVAAMILFGSFFFRHWLLGLIGIVAVMGLSDLRLGLYDSRLMLTVYLSLAFAILLGRLLKQGLGSNWRGWFWIPGFAGASLAMSTVFFLLTNAACWLGSTYYSQDLAGLLTCYAAGLPFFGRTLMGDLMFTMGLAGCYAAVTSFLHSRAVEEDQEAVRIGSH
jgi:hypothetical protein